MYQFTSRGGCVGEAVIFVGNGRLFLGVIIFVGTDRLHL